MVEAHLTLRDGDDEKEEGVLVKKEMSVISSMVFGIVLQRWQIIGLDPLKPCLSLHYYYLKTY